MAQKDVINAIYYIASGSMEVLQGESVAAILGKRIVTWFCQLSLKESTSLWRKIRRLNFG